MYIFDAYNEAKTELESYGLTVDDIYLTMLTNLGSSSRRANLYYNGDIIGYIETPNEIQPDEKWVVNIGYAKRATLPEGMVTQIYETEDPMLGWTDRQTYHPTNNFSRVKVNGIETDFALVADGPSATVNIELGDDNFDFLKINNNTLSLSVDINNLTQAIRYRLGELATTMAIRKIEPNDVKKSGSPTPKSGDILIIDDDNLVKWMDGANVPSSWHLSYIMSTILG